MENDLLRREWPGDDHCVVCRQRVTAPEWMPFCSEVCYDSHDAEVIRLVERGAYTARLDAP